MEANGKPPPDTYQVLLKNLLRAAQREAALCSMWQPGQLLPLASREEMSLKKLWREELSLEELSVAEWLLADTQPVHR
jgi:hypothetical protein